MGDPVFINVIDHALKPQKWYEISDFAILGFQLITSKEDQKFAGSKEGPPPKKQNRRFGPNPIKPYRDYYGKFTLKTTLVSETIKAQFAIGYTINSLINTVDDFSNFSWLRLATEKEDVVYPNLSEQKQLLDYLTINSRYPRLIVIRVYHYLQMDLYHNLTTEIQQRENFFYRK